MGLMDQAVETAHAQDAARKAAQTNATRRKGEEVAAHFSDTFGLEATWIDFVKVVDYQKKYRNYGGHEWVRRERATHRLQVDDVKVGITDKTYSSSSDYVVWRACPSCGNVEAVTLESVYVYTKDTPDENRAKLIAAIGKAMTSTTPCTACQARPCECCGRAN